jgi:uncharacterized protein (TIGR03437 family)
MSKLSASQLVCSLASVALIAPSLRGQAQPIISGVYGGSSSGVVAPAEAVDVNGANLTGPNGSPAPVVLVNGVATLVNPSGSTHLQVLVPPRSPLGPATLVVSVNGVASDPYPMTVQEYVPYLAGYTGGSDFLHAFHADGSQILPSSPAAPGETISAVVTGLGGTTPIPSPSVSLGGFPAAVQFIEPYPNYPVPVGYLFLNFTVPPDVPTGDQAMVMSIGGFTSLPNVNWLVPVVATGLILSQTGATFQAVTGSATTFQQSVFIIATNQVTTWTAAASTISGGNWQQVSPATGTSDPSQSPSSIQILASAQNLAPGSYYGQVTISPVDTNSAQTITVVLNVLPQGQFPGESLQPTGLLFTSTAGAAAPSAQTIQITNPSSITLSFSGTASVPSGTPWFQFNPQTGTVAPGAPVTITVQPSTSLPSGIYPGSVNFHFSDGSQRVLSLLWVVASTGSTSSSSLKSSSSRPLDTATCTPNQLEPQFTLLGVNFSSPVAWPSAIAASIVDNCGNPMTSGSVALSFSNGDPPLGMSPVQDGTWTATWTPVNPVTSALVVTLTAQLLSPPIMGTEQVSGSAPANPLVPIVNSGGVVSTASYAASPAPGALISIFGAALAGSSAAATGLPLTDQLETTQLAIGGVSAPLLYVGDTQINALVPYGLQTNAKYTIIAQRGTAISSPQTISVQEAQPGVFTADESGKGQGYVFKIASDGSETLAAPGAPATAGDVLVIYCAGLGEVQPSLQAGMPAPLMPLEYTVNPVTATIGGVSANVAFGGLTPGFAGLYQVNLTVPSGVTPGDSVPLLLSVAGTSSVPVTMALH